MIFYLVYPRIPPALTSWDYAGQMLFKRGGNPPLGLLTMAGMIPRHHQIIFCDENNSTVNFDQVCDYVCLTGMHLQKNRIKEIAAEFRKRGKKVILGGPSLMAVPEEYADHIDIRIIGEAERIWPECLKDLEHGVEKPTYIEAEKVDLRLSPIPRYDLVSTSDYWSVSIQTTRGCPYLCEFCDIITLYGRKPRVKDVAQVIEELRFVLAMGARNIFFSDDNFIGDPRYTKSLLLEIIELQKTLDKKFTFYCQVTINLAKNTELLELLRLAGCKSVFIGIETPRLASLKETGKVQNLRHDLLQDVKTIRSYGIMIMSGVVLGFDHDDPTIFHEQLVFLQDANIPTPLTTMLGALPGTPLHQRLVAENRLVEDIYTADSYSTNISPKLMTRKQLYEGFAWLNEEMYKPANYTKRILGEIVELEANPLKKKAFSPLLMICALAWVLMWYVLDKHRRSLLSVFWQSVPVVLSRHFDSLEHLVEYLFRYRHVCHIVTSIRSSCTLQFGEGPRWEPPLFKAETGEEIPQRISALQK